MPTAIAYVATQVSAWAIAAATAAGASATVASAIGTVTFVGAELAETAGIGLLAAAIDKPKLASPEAAQEPLNQTRPPVRWGTGRYRVSGPAVLWSSVPGWDIESRLIHEGPVDGFEQVYLNDDLVTLKDNNYVASYPAGSTNQRYAENLIKIFLRPGRATEIPTPDLVAVAGSQWTTAHRCDGVAAVDMMVACVKDTDLARCYPNGQPAISVLTRLSKVYDWRDETQVLTNPSTWKWSENACLGHVTWEWFGRFLVSGAADYVTPNAAQLNAWATLFEPSLDYWTTAADICDEVVTLKDGTTEARYRAAVLTMATDQPDTIRQSYLRSYDGWMMRRSDGAWTIRAGQYVTPTLQLTDSNIIGIEWDLGQDPGTLTNILTGNFLDPDNNYTSQAVDPWEDAAGVADEGEISEDFDLTMVPSHGQARRLMKRELYRQRADYNGTVTCDLSGLDIGDFAHRWIRIVRDNGPASTRNVVVEVTGEVQVDWSKLQVSIPIRSSGADIDEWTPAAEEGFKPNDTVRTPPDVLLAPEITDTYAVFQSDNSALIVVKIVDPSDPSRTYQLTYLDSSGNAFDGPWLEADVVSGGLELRCGPVGIGDYYVQVRANIAGRITDWSNPPELVHVNQADAPYVAPTYNDGTDINRLKPAQIGADKTSTNTSADTAAVAGTPAATVLANITNANQAAALANLNAQGAAAVIQALSKTPDGQAVITQVLNAIYQSATALSAVNLLAVINEDGTAAVLNLNSVMKTPTQTLAEFFNEVDTVIGGGETTISELAESIDGLQGQYTLQVVTMANGVKRVAGLMLGTTVASAGVYFTGTEFGFLDDTNPGAPFYPFRYTNEDGFEFDTNVTFNGAALFNKSVATAAIADNAVTDHVANTTGSIADIGAETSIMTLTINPNQGRVRLEWVARVSNGGGQDCAVRIKILRNGTRLDAPGSLIYKVSNAFTEPCVEFMDDDTGGTSDVTYEIRIQAVTGTDIGDTGGSNYGAGLQSCTFSLESIKK